VTTTTLPDTAIDQAKAIHDEAIVFDMISCLFPWDFPRCLDHYAEGKVSAVSATIDDPVTGGNPQSAHEGFRAMAKIYELLQQEPERLLLVQEYPDFQRAKEQGKLGLVINAQDGALFERTPSFVEPLYRLGVRSAQLTYNIHNGLADGCVEPTDAGLTKIGKQVVREMNRVGMVVDGSHTGRRSSLEAIELCDAPFIFSHSGCKTLYDHPRNITDEQIKACAATGGVVGIVGLPYFLGDPAKPSLELMIRHIVHAVELAGVEHVGFGSDHYTGNIPYTSYEEQLAGGRTSLGGVFWNPGDIPPPPLSGTPGLETPAGTPRLTAALLKHGFSEPEVRKIMGENFLRVFQQAWKPTS
jgi:membrane dipeptidase